MHDMNTTQGKPTCSQFTVSKRTVQDTTDKTGNYKQQTKNLLISNAIQLQHGAEITV